MGRYPAVAIMAEEYFEEQFDPYVERRKGSSTAFKLQFHIVFATKYRRPVLKGEAASKLQNIFIQVCKGQGYRLLGLSIVKDHVHVLLDLKPTDKLSEVMNHLKGRSAHDFLMEFPDLRNLVGKNNLWSGGYSVDSLGRANAAQVKAYLGRQEEHHTINLRIESGI